MLMEKYVVNIYLNNKPFLAKVLPLAESCYISVREKLKLPYTVRILTPNNFPLDFDSE